LAVAQQVAAIAVKRAPPSETFFLERDEVETLLRRLPAHGRHALRDRALFLVLYNTGARVQEIADLRIEHLDLGPQPRVRLHGKGDKWRICPLWPQTVDVITRLLREASSTPPPTRALFTSHGTRALTRFGLYKIVLWNRFIRELISRSFIEISFHARSFTVCSGDNHKMIWMIDGKQN
jgi:integrase